MRRYEFNLKTTIFILTVKFGFFYYTLLEILVDFALNQIYA